MIPAYLTNEDIPSLHLPADSYNVKGDVVSQLREENERTRGKDDFRIVDKRKAPRD